MGQQQLLLIILVTIVIGIATIVAINIIGNGRIDANRDAVRQDLSAAASYVQSIWERPQIMGGAGKDFEENMTEAKILQYLNVPASEFQIGDSEASNENGRYFVSIQSDSELLITGEPNTGPPNIQVTVKQIEDGQWTFEFSEGGNDDSGGGGSGGPQRGTDSQRQGRF
jgi:hypothetical protein